MSDKITFQRCEIKYILDYADYLQLQKLMAEYMQIDSYGDHQVHSIYMDTDDFLLIRRSIEKPQYKEKLRVRGYNNISQSDEIFIEMKKKYKGVVYKRRVAMPSDDAMKYLSGDCKPNFHNQIIDEIDYFLDFYGSLKPAMMISCDRQAYFCKNDSDLRITFDKNILARDYDLSIQNGAYGASLLENSKVLLEVKTSLGLPIWLVDFFSQNNIFKTSFSKYGTAYKMLLFPKINFEFGGGTYVA